MKVNNAGVTGSEIKEILDELNKSDIINVVDNKIQTKGDITTNFYIKNDSLDTYALTQVVKFQDIKPQEFLLASPTSSFFEPIELGTNKQLIVKFEGVGDAYSQVILAPSAGDNINNMVSLRKYSDERSQYLILYNNYYTNTDAGHVYFYKKSDNLKAASLYIKGVGTGPSVNNTLQFPIKVYLVTPKSSVTYQKIQLRCWVTTADGRQYSMFNNGVKEYTNVTVTGSTGGTQVISTNTDVIEISRNPGNINEIIINVDFYYGSNYTNIFTQNGSIYFLTGSAKINYEGQNINAIDSVIGGYNSTAGYGIMNAKASKDNLNIELTASGSGSTGYSYNINGFDFYVSLLGNEF